MEKEERNRLFIQDWKSGTGNKELGKKYHLGVGGVKGLKARLRKKDPGLYAGRKQRKPVLQKSIITQKSKRTKEEKRINVTIRFLPDFFMEAKIYAIKHKSKFPTFSALIEQALREKIRGK